jgi:hypothetical protein
LRTGGSSGNSQSVNGAEGLAAIFGNSQDTRS